MISRRTIYQSGSLVVSVAGLPLIGSRPLKKIGECSKKLLVGLVTAYLRCMMGDCEMLMGVE